MKNLYHANNLARFEMVELLDSLADNATRLTVVRDFESYVTSRSVFNDSSTNVYMDVVLRRSRSAIREAWEMVAWGDPDNIVISEIDLTGRFIKGRSSSYAPMSRKTYFGSIKFTQIQRRSIESYLILMLAVKY